MKNKFWNKRFFLEALRQLKIPGIIGVVIYTIMGIMIPIGAGIGNFSGKVEFMFIEKMSIMIGIPVVFVSIMMLVSFNYLNKRNSSDFYHSIPIRRESLYIHCILAVIAWALLMVIAATASASISVAFNRILWVDLRSTVFFILEIVAGIILVAGGFGIAVSVTGTTFTNFSVALMILVVPDAIFEIIREIINEFTPYIPFEYGMSSWFLESHNVLFSYFDDLFAGIEADTGSLIYSTVLGVIFMVVGLLVFRMRKSEVASKPSLNGFWQTVFRMVPAFLVCLAGCYYVLNVMYHEEYRIDDYCYTYYARDEMIFYIFLYYIIAVIIYFLYELVTSRKWKQVGKSAKFLPILVCLNLVVITGVWFSAKSANEKTFDKESVEWIKVESFPYSYDSIILRECNDVKIYSEDIISEITESYNQQSEAIVKNGEDPEYLLTDGVLDVAIHYKGRTYYRNVGVEDSCIKKVVEECKNQENIGIIVNKIIKYKKYNFEDMYVQDFSLETEMIEKLYDSFIEELGASDSPLDILSVRESSAYETIVCHTRNYENVWKLRISGKTPKTLNLLKQYLDGITLTDAVNTIDKFGYNNFDRAVSVRISLQTDSGKNIDTDWYFESYSDYSDNSNASMLKNLSEYVDGLEKTDKIDGQNVLVVRLTISNYYDYSYEEGLEVYILSDEEAQKVLEIISTYE